MGGPRHHQPRHSPFAARGRDKDNQAVLNSDIMYHWIVSPLHKGKVHCKTLFIPWPAIPAWPLRMLLCLHQKPGQAFFPSSASGRSERRYDVIPEYRAHFTTYRSSSPVQWSYARIHPGFWWLGQVISFLYLTGFLSNRPGHTTWSQSFFRQGISLSPLVVMIWKNLGPGIWTGSFNVSTSFAHYDHQWGKVSQLQCFKRLALLLTIPFNPSAGLWPHRTGKVFSRQAAFPAVFIHRPFTLLPVGDMVMSVRYSFTAPVFGSIPIPLSFRMMSISASATPACSFLQM